MTKKKCPLCAEEIIAEAIYCKHCKSDIGTPSQTTVKKGGFNMKGTFVFFGILFFIMIVAVAVSEPGDYSGESTASSSTTTSVDREPTACDIHAFVAGAVIEGYTKYPDEARKPSCTEARLVSTGGDTYQMSGYVIASNALGTEGRLYYTVDLRYKGGSPMMVSNWEVLSEPTITERN